MHKFVHIQNSAVVDICSLSGTQTYEDTRIAEEGRVSLLKRGYLKLLIDGLNAVTKTGNQVWPGLHY